MRTLRQTLPRSLGRGAPWLVACVAALALAGCGAAGHGSRAKRSTTASTAPAPTTAPTPTAAPTTPATPTTTTATTPSPAAPAVTYGIGDAQGQFAHCTPTAPDCCPAQRARCNRSQVRGFYDDPLFLKLITPASAHRVRDVRLFVAYDAVEAWNGSTTSPGCVLSQVLEHPWSDVANGPQSAGESIADLLAGVIEARAEGLEPVVSIQGYPYAAARPPGDAAVPDPTTIGGYWEYRCGLEGILGALSRLPAWEQPHVWEALNEPDDFPIFRGTDTASASTCAVGATPQPDGPAKAACDEVIASRVIHDYADHDGDTVLAGTFKRPSASYLAPYAAELALRMGGTAFPATWSVHDYEEVTGAFAGVDRGDLAAFDAALDHDTDGRAQSLWVTEAGTVLTSATRDGECPAVGVDAAGTLGACVSGQRARQTADAQTFFDLPEVAAAVPITHLFWYQFQGAPKWDSGLVDPSGAPRVAYCVFYGSGECAGSLTAS